MFRKRRLESWLGWEHHPPQTLVYEQGNRHLAVEEINEFNSNLFKYPLSTFIMILLHH